MLQNRVVAAPGPRLLPLASGNSHRKPSPRRRPRVWAASSDNDGATAPSTSSPSTSSPSDLPALKTQLLRLVARIEEKGNSADPSISDSDRRAVLRSVEALEARNPTPEPAVAPASSKLLSGEWALLYVGPGTVPEETEEEKKELERAQKAEKNAAGAEWRKKSGGLEGPVLSALSPLAFKGRLVKRTGVSQVIDADSGTISNVASFALFNGSKKGYLDVRGSAKRAEDSATRVDVAFEAAEICVPPLKFSIPLSWASPKGWVET